MNISCHCCSERRSSQLTSTNTSYSTLYNKNRVTQLYTVTYVRILALMLRYTYKVSNEG